MRSGYKIVSRVANAALFFCENLEENMARRSNGEGTIFKRKDGRWCAAYFDDNEKRRYVYGKTQAEAKQKLKNRKKQEEVSTRKDYVFQEWIKEYLENHKRNEVKITTYCSYIDIYRKHIEASELGELFLSEITTHKLQVFYNQKIAEGYNSKTVKHIQVVIKSALEQAVRERVINENPDTFTSIPKKVQYEAKTLSREEVDILLNKAKGEELYPIVVSTIYTGMRKGEIMALKWENVDFNARKIHVRNSLCRIVDEESDDRGRRHARYQLLAPKSKKSIRTIPMTEEVYEALVEQKRRQNMDKVTYKGVYNDQGFVFADYKGEHLAQRTFMEKYHKLLRKYDVTDVRFHDLRHTFATMLIESDVSMRLVQELLGHSTITTSMDIYTHVSDRKKMESIMKLSTKPTE